MCVKPKWLKDLHVPDFILDGAVLSQVSRQKYLGYSICDNMFDNDDIPRQTRCTYTRGNTIINKFRNCSSDVKSKLFKAYCTNFYGINLWSLYNVET